MDSLTREWYKIRDACLGWNCVPQNIFYALYKAMSCKHPDACWLTESFAGKDVKTEEEATQIFANLGSNDARALCFLWVRGTREDFTILRRSAELGYAFAQALMASETRFENRFKFALLAAAQGEREGFFWLGWCFRDGEGCERNLKKAQENFLLASEFGYTSAMIRFADVLHDSDAQRWRWSGRAAALGNGWLFLTKFSKQVNLFKSGLRSANVIFVIGKALQGHVNERKRTIFKNEFGYDSNFEPANQAIAFYEAQIKATKAAVYAWTLVGIRWKVVKDIRKVIGMLIWNSREEALYD